MSKIVKNYIYNIIFQMLVLFIPLILSPYLVRTLGSHNLGIYSYISSIASIITSVALLGTYDYGCRQIAYTRDFNYKCEQNYNEIFTLRLFLGIIATVIYVIVAIVEREYFSYFILYYFWILASFIDPSWFFVGEEDMRPTAIKNSCIKLFTVGLIFLIIRNSDHLARYLIIMAGTTLLANLVLFLQLNRYSIKRQLSLNNWKIHCKESLALFWPQVASLFYLQVDKVMLRVLASNIDEVSYYDYGEKIVTIPLTFITVLSTVMMPRIANEYKKDNMSAVSNLLSRAAGFSLMLAFPMMLGMIICAPKLVPWYLGENYTSTISVIICISPMIITNALTSISGKQYFVATNQTKIILKAYVSAAIVNIIINALLIPKFDCLGAGIATVVSATVSVIIQYYYMNVQIGIKQVLIHGMRYLFLSLPMATFVFFIGIKRDATISTTALQVVIGLVSYAATLIIIKDENIKALMKKVHL